jgi:hypothetical protein
MVNTPMWNRHSNITNIYLYVATFRHHLYMEHNFSQLTQYSRVCGAYGDFLDRGLLITRKQFNQGFLVVKLKLSLRKFYGHHHDLVIVTEYLCHKWPSICSICRNHNPIISLFRTCHQICNECNMMDTTSGVGMLTLPEHLSSPPPPLPILVGFVLLDF